MKEVIKIGNIEVELSNNVAWTMEYRDQFGKDIIPVILPALATVTEALSAVLSEAYEEGASDSDKVEISKERLAEAIRGNAMEILLPLYQFEFVDSIVNVTWAMAKAANDTILPPKQWVRQFDEFPLDVVGPAIFKLLLKGFGSSKNLKRLEELIEEVKASLQPKEKTSHSTTSSSQESNED